MQYFLSLLVASGSILTSLVGAYSFHVLLVSAENSYISGILLTPEKNIICHHVDRLPPSFWTKKINLQSNGILFASYACHSYTTFLPIKLWWFLSAPQLYLSDWQLTSLPPMFILDPRRFLDEVGIQNHLCSFVRENIFSTHSATSSLRDAILQTCCYPMAISMANIQMRYII